MGIFADLLRLALPFFGLLILRAQAGTTMQPDMGCTAHTALAKHAGRDSTWTACVQLPGDAALSWREDHWGCYGSSHVRSIAECESYVDLSYETLLQLGAGSLSCDSGFSVDDTWNASLTETDDGTCGSDGICVNRWKCKCDTSQCTRAATEGTLTGAQQYYDFEAAVPSDVTVDSANRAALMDNLTAAFNAHCTERNSDLRATLSNTSTQLLGEGYDAGGIMTIMTNLGKCPSNPTVDTPSTCEFKNNMTAVDDSNCKDFALPNPSCYAASFAQVEDLLSQAEGKDFETFLNDELGAVCTDNTLLAKHVKARASWGMPTMNDTRFAAGYPVTPHGCRGYHVHPDEASNVAFPTVTFPQFDSTTSPHWEFLRLRSKSSTKFRAALQLLICPDGRVDGKLSGFLMPFYACDNTTQPCATCTNQSTPQYCGGTIDYATLDAAFRKVTAASRFKLAKSFASSSDVSCSSSTWDGRTCMNSLMDAESSKCHIVNVSFACRAGITWDTTRSGEYCNKNGGWASDFAARTQKSLSDCKASCEADASCRSITHGTYLGEDTCALCSNGLFTADQHYDSAAWTTTYTYNPSDSCASSDPGRSGDGDYENWRVKSDGRKMPLPHAFKECVQGGAKHGTCSFKLCNDDFSFDLNWPMQFEFAGAYSASRQWYDADTWYDGATSFSFDWD